MRIYVQYNMLYFFLRERNNMLYFIYKFSLIPSILTIATPGPELLEMRYQRKRWIVLPCVFKI